MILYFYIYFYFLSSKIITGSTMTPSSLTWELHAAQLDGKPWTQRWPKMPGRTMQHWLRRGPDHLLSHRYLLVAYHLLLNHEVTSICLPVTCCGDYYCLGSCPWWMSQTGQSLVCILTSCCMPRRTPPRSTVWLAAMESIQSTRCVTGPSFRSHSCLQSSQGFGHWRNCWTDWGIYMAQIPELPWNFTRQHVPR